MTLLDGWTHANHHPYPTENWGAVTLTSRKNTYDPHDCAHVLTLSPYYPVPGQHRQVPP
jgi:hypothetical protein